MSLWGKGEFSWVRWSLRGIVACGGRMGKRKRKRMAIWVGVGGGTYRLADRLALRAARRMCGCSRIGFARRQARCP